MSMRGELLVVTMYRWSEGVMIHPWWWAAGQMTIPAYSIYFRQKAPDVLVFPKNVFCFQHPTDICSDDRISDQSGVAPYRWIFG